MFDSEAQAAKIRAMKIRIGFAPGIGPSLDGPTFATIVDALEDVGFDSVWVPEVMTGANLDPIAALAFAAGRVRKLKLGTQLILPGRNIYRAARACATLDRLSGGRLLVTAVPGLETPDEKRALGVPSASRTPLLEANLLALRALWRGEAVDGITVDVRPAQTPLEVWMGGNGPKGLERAGRLSDGWIPGFVTIDEAVAGRATVIDAAAAAGREISDEHFGANVLYAREPLSPDAVARLGERAARVPIGWDAVRDVISRYVAGGISKFVVRPAVSPATPVQWSAEITDAAAHLLDLQTPSRAAANAG